MTLDRFYQVLITGIRLRAERLALMTSLLGCKDPSAVQTGRYPLPGSPRSKGRSLFSDGIWLSSSSMPKLCR